MILQLTKGNIKVKLMVIPEPLEKLYIQYVFESGTNHLLPRLTITTPSGKTLGVFLGDRIFINTEAMLGPHDVILKVELLDANKIAVRTYTCPVLYVRYCTFGERPLRPDLDAYIHSLEVRVAELEEKGEVI